MRCGTFDMSSVLSEGNEKESMRSCQAQHNLPIDKRQHAATRPTAATFIPQRSVLEKTCLVEEDGLSMH